RAAARQGSEPARLGGPPIAQGPDSPVAGIVKRSTPGQRTGKRGQRTTRKGGSDRKGNARFLSEPAPFPRRSPNGKRKRAGGPSRAWFLRPLFAFLRQPSCQRAPPGDTGAVAGPPRRPRFRDWAG